VSPASTQQCVLPVQIVHRTGMEAVDRTLSHGRANLPVLRGAEGQLVARGQVVASDLQR
jgi:hypothetical protein